MAPPTQGAAGADTRSDLHWTLIAAVFLQIACGGVRFVDGPQALAFSKAGFRADLRDFSQYLFDSPLKIAFLHMVGLQSEMALDALFAALNLLPVVAILLVARDRPTRMWLFTVFAALPLTKLMFQNTGIGDSVMVAATIVVVVAQAPMAAAAATMVMVLWHFQQGLLMSLTVCALCLALGGPENRVRLRYVLGGALGGLVAFGVIRILCVPEHTGRLGFILTHMGPYLARNLRHLPVALCAAIPGLILMVAALARFEGRARVRLRIVVGIATILAVCVAGLTTDFSRVVVLLTYPIVLFLSVAPAAQLPLTKEFTDSRVLVPLAAISVVTPFYSWSGIDFFLWSSFAEMIRASTR